MHLRAVALAVILISALSAAETWADISCGGMTRYYDWDCHYVARRGWRWELILVGIRSCDCNADPHCSLEGRTSSCRSWNLTETCGGGNSCQNNQGDSCEEPPPDPDTCRGPVPPADREGWALHDGTAGTYTPDGRFSYNSTGGSKQISNTGWGRYTVTFAGLGGLDGGVQVVAYGPSNHRCKVAGWSGVPDLRIDVRCHTPAGAPVNTPFLVHFFATDDVATPYREIGHARFEVPQFPPLPPVPGFQWNSNGPLPTTTAIGTGDYMVRFPNLLHADGSAVVTSLGTGPEFCQVVSTALYTAGPETGTAVRVWCFDSAGAFVDSGFTLRYERRQGVTAFWVRDGYAYANHASFSSYAPDWQYNSTAATNVAARVSPGVYTLTYPDLPPPGAPGSAPTSTVLMSARTVGPSYCKVTQWGGAGDDTTVTGRCYNFTGALGDRTYQQVYLRRSPLTFPLP